MPSMAEFLSILWTIFSFIFGILWSIVWFILSDLLSTLLWIGIAVYIAFVLRYRSFHLGALALLRYGRYGLTFLWRWLRGRPADGMSRPTEPVTKIVREYKERVPLGHASVSEQLNVLTILLLILMAHV
jgi:hypothetical protein